MRIFSCDANFMVIHSGVYPEISRNQKLPLSLKNIGGKKSLRSEKNILYEHTLPQRHICQSQNQIIVTFAHSISL